MENNQNDYLLERKEGSASSLLIDAKSPVQTHIN